MEASPTEKSGLRSNERGPNETQEPAPIKQSFYERAGARNLSGAAGRPRLIFFQRTRQIEHHPTLQPYPHTLTTWTT